MLAKLKIKTLKDVGQLRQKKMNRSEQKVQIILRQMGYETIPQVTRMFPLDGGGTYTPDFIAWKKGDPGLVVCEVKGGYRGPGWEQGMERYKRAASQYSSQKNSETPFNFLMIEYIKGTPTMKWW